MDEQPIFIIKNIRKTFRSGSCVCYNFELNIKNGKFTFITGDSGIGKSTLLHMLGLLDTAEPIITDSELQYISNKPYNYFKMTKKDKSFLRCSEFGFLPQGGHVLQPLSVMENLILAYKHRNQSNSDDMENNIKKIMEKVGLNVAEKNDKGEIIENSIWNRRNISPINFSGGEKQRLALARTILCDPKVIFVDEPTTYMDKPTAKLCIQVLQNCIKEKGSTVILVTHDYDELLGYIDNKKLIERYHLIKTSEEKNASHIAIDEKESTTRA